MLIGVQNDGDQMPEMRMSLVQGAVVVFEGLDKAGKSTQLAALREVTDDASLFIHMPSGISEFSRKLYGILESSKPASTIGRQLAHLACHAENISLITASQENAGLVLDRWWWSTVAYGWYGDSLIETGWKENAFYNLIEAIWSSIRPDVVFLFLDPRADDANNLPAVEVGYRALGKEYHATTVLVPDLDESSTLDFILAELAKRELIESK